MFILCVTLVSCAEKAKIISLEKMEIKIDTIYVYKIELSNDEGKFYKIIKISDKYETGDVIQIIR